MKILMIIATLSLNTIASSFAQENQNPPSNLANTNDISNLIIEEIKLKDISKIRPNDSNILTGIGIVAELIDKGDSSKEKEILNQALNTIDINNIDLTKIESKNIVLVSVTTKTNGNIIKGTNQNICIASILDSKDLTNGILLQTELRNKEGKILATESGPISTNSKSKGTGYILNGTTIYDNQEYKNYNIILEKEDYTLINSISKKLTSKKIENNIKSGKIIEIEIQKIKLLSEIEEMAIENIPKVSINEQNKLIIASKNVEIGPLIFSIERDKENLFSNKKNEQIKIDIQKMTISGFILKNSDTLNNEELIKIIKVAKKINKLNGELILEE